MSGIQRDLASTELWHDSLERSLRRRALAPIARKRDARRKRTSVVVASAVATAPIYPTVTGAAATVPRKHDDQKTRSLHDARNDRILLRRGDSSPAVGDLQRALAIQADAIYGKQTEAAVRGFQTLHRLPVSGKVDVRTWLSLFPNDAIIAVNGQTSPNGAHPSAQWAAVTVPPGSSPIAAASKTQSQSTAHSSAANAVEAVASALGMNRAGAAFAPSNGGSTTYQPVAAKHDSGGSHAQAPVLGVPRGDGHDPASSHGPTGGIRPGALPQAVSKSPSGQGAPTSQPVKLPIPTGSGTAATLIAEMIAAANAIDGHHYAYQWGGGHNSSFSGPYDCSGAVSAVLHAAGLLAAPMVSGDFMHWGAPGRGAVTIYANASHVYMSINGHFFGTSYANPGGGAGWFNGSARPGFVVVHVPFERMHLRPSAARAQAAVVRRHKRRGTTVAYHSPSGSSTTGGTAAPAPSGDGTTSSSGTAPAPQPSQGTYESSSAAPAAPAATAPAPSGETAAPVAVTTVPTATAPAAAPTAPASTVPAAAPTTTTAPAAAPAPATPVTPAPAASAPAPGPTADTAAPSAPAAVAPAAPSVPAAPTADTPAPAAPAATPPAPAAAPSDSATTSTADSAASTAATATTDAASSSDATATDSTAADAATAAPAPAATTTAG